MFSTFFGFELRYRFRQPAVWIFAVVFALLCFGATTTDAVIIGGSSGQVAINAPYVVTYTLANMSTLAILIVTAFCATAVTRDYEMGFDGLLFTRPLKKLDFLAGRFVGSIVVSMVVMLGCSVGLFVGSFMWWLDPARLVDHSLVPHLYGLVVFALPNLLVTGSFFFALATLTKRMLAAYVGVAAFFVLYGLAQTYVGKLDNEFIAAMSDPFGIAAFELDTRYWTPAERNTILPPLSGPLMANRALWLLLGLATFAFTVVRFRFDAPARKAAKDTSKSEEPQAVSVDHASNVPRVTPSFGWKTSLHQWWSQTRVELRAILRSRPFLVLLLLCMLQLVGGGLGFIDQMYGTSVYPVTHLMVTVLDTITALFMLIVIVFFAGEAIHRERKLKFGEVFDAMPMPYWVPLLAKTTALIGTVVVLTGFGMLVTMGLQLFRGFTDIEMAVYLKGLLGDTTMRWALLCVLAIFFQVAANHKYLGFGLMLLHFIAGIALPAMGLQHKLYRYGAGTGGTWSDMNTYGHYAERMFWFDAYWLLSAGILLSIANLFWVRGTDHRWKQRIRRARGRVNSVNTAVLAVLLTGFGAVGIYIFYNTNIVNDYFSQDELEQRSVLYEQRYKQYEDLPQPRLEAVDVAVDIFPAERKVDVEGTLDLKNETDEHIEELHVQVDSDAEIHRLEIPAATLEKNDEELGYRIYRFETPLAPGAALKIPFALTIDEEGFRNNGENDSIAFNGTFVNNGSLVPHFGYNPSGELSDPNERREYDLPERPRMPSIDDEKARANTYISSESDWIDFAATVSTSSDQIALAPGYLQKQWEQDGRRYYRYEMDAPILNFYSFLSARYEVARDSWKDVAIEVYYHPGHDYNVERMIDAVKKSLDYYTENFSPYQHRQVRIVEFPRYASFAQSFPNTIPYSESIGFIADLRDEEAIDYVFYVTAHEVAHQWWAHQVIGANVQGATMLSETFSQYSALMVMEKEYGPEKMKRFLEYELDRYLQGRASELERELPLSLVENQQYIHYNKGSLAMYALRDYIGEDRLNRALSRYIEKVGFQSAPYTTSLEFLEILREEVPAKYAYLVRDLFETITLYDNRVLEATTSALEDGRWKVQMKVLTKKYRGTESGAEEPIELDDWIEVAIYGKDEAGERTTLYRKKHRFSGEEQELSFEVDAEPAEAGIDPRNLLVDRNPDDNLRPVSKP